MKHSTRRFFPVALSRALVASVLALGGCAGHGITRVLHENACNKPQPYQRAGTVSPLRMPVGIDPPDTHGALRVPAYDEPVPPPRKLTDPCLDAPPSFVVSRPGVVEAPRSVPAR